MEMIYIKEKDEIMVFYVKKIKNGFAGKAHGFIILILKKYKDDKGLHEHEKTHVKQWWKMGLLIHSLLYKFNKKYRYKCELEAYGVQMRYSNYPELYAKYISTRYNLDVSYEEALRNLKGE